MGVIIASTFHAPDRYCGKCDQSTPGDAMPEVDLTLSVQHPLLIALQLLL
jgi:hypothetical protein